MAGRRESHNGQGSEQGFVTKPKPPGGWVGNKEQGPPFSPWEVREPMRLEPRMAQHTQTQKFQSVKGKIFVLLLCTKPKNFLHCIENFLQRIAERNKTKTFIIELLKGF